MSRTFFHSLADEVDSLISAGSASAATDHRLPRRVAALRELARQVPALANLAEAVSRVCQPDSPQSSRALLDLVLLVRQVRVGTGSESLKGEVSPLPPSGPWVNNLPADELYRMVEAVRSDPCNADLIEPLLPNDLRLVPLLTLSQDQQASVSNQIQLLDRWGEEGNRAALRLLPSFGRAALAELERDFDFGKRPGAGRRLAAMGLIDLEAALQFCRLQLPQQPGLLGLLGKVGGSAVEVFVKVLAHPHGNYANWDLDRIATALLTQVPEQAVEALRPDLQSSDPALRQEAIALLGLMGRPAAAAYPDLIACLQDLDSDVRRAAAEALPKLGAPAAKVLPLLIEALEHPDEPIRLAVIEVLGRSASRNKTVQATLRQAKEREKSAVVRNRIGEILKKG